MGKIIAFVSQKGGVGKSTLARAFATEASKSKVSVKIADLDTQQGTVADWHRQRLNNGHNPIGSVEIFAKAEQAFRYAKDFDLLVIDGTPRASKGTLDIAKKADLVVLPTCTSRDDLIPTLKLASDLEKKGISRNILLIAFVRVATPAEISDAQNFIKQYGYTVVKGSLDEKASYRQAQNQGLAVTETRYKTLNKKADELIENIYKKLIGD